MDPNACLVRWLASSPLRCRRDAEQRERAAATTRRSGHALALQQGCVRLRLWLLGCRAALRGPRALRIERWKGNAGQMEKKLGLGTRLERVPTLTEMHVWPAWCAGAQSETELHDAQEQRIEGDIRQRGRGQRGMDGASARQRNPRAHTCIHTATLSGRPPRVARQ